MKTLAVVSEVFTMEQGARTVNRGFNVLLASYSRHFDVIHHIGPGAEQFTHVQSDVTDNLYLSSVTGYDKPPLDRLYYYLTYRRARRRFRALLEGSATIVQVRIPSLFAMQAVPVVRELGLPLTTYVAGEWGSSFAANYPFWGSPLVGRLLERWQRPVIESSIPVASGPVLARQCSTSSVHCHPYYATTHQEVEERAPRTPPNQLILVGRLEPRKRVEDAIRAVGILGRRGRKVRLSILGKGAGRTEELKRLARREQVSDQVAFKGYLPDKENVKEEYRKADILVHPSVSEGAIKVLPEAMAHGVVPIGVRGTGSNDITIGEKETGCLVPAESPEAIADCVGDLQDHPEKFKRLMERGYEHARNHTLDAEVQRMWNHVLTRAGLGSCEPTALTE